MVFFVLSLFLLFGLFLFYKIWFLRNPHLFSDFSSGAIIAPADGRVLKIIKYDNSPVNVYKNNRYFSLITKDVSPKGYIIVILMNIFNIHWQKAPLSGKILSIRYEKGKFLNAVWGADSLKATIENEKNEILIKTTLGRMKVIQVAGVIARRIVCLVKAGQKVEQGEDLGLIKLGSQVILVLPAVKLKIKEGDKIVVGKTIMADRG